MTDLFHSPLYEHIRKYFQNLDSGQQTTFVFAPYVKTDILEKLLEGLQNRVVIVTTWEPTDILSGSSEIGLYPFCKERGISLYVSQGMHLKVYSVDLTDAILATGNVSRRGLMPDGNYEVGTLIKSLTNEDRLFFERIRRRARLVDDAMYEELAEWSNNNRVEIQGDVSLENIISTPDRDNFLISALPMTQSVDGLVLYYDRICQGEMPSEDPEIAACVFHDLANYGIEPGLSEIEFRQELSSKFFAHPFIQKINEFIAPEAYFGRIKEWIQDNCTDVPVPSRRELTGNVQVLLKWFERLGGGTYVIDIPGRRSQRIRRLDVNQSGCYN